jgi:hypothetical protein
VPIKNRVPSHGCANDGVQTKCDPGNFCSAPDGIGRELIALIQAGFSSVYPEGHALETMARIEQGPHASLDAALAEIERHTRGVCRRSTGEDQS